jgi:hypothetical protein
MPAWMPFVVDKATKRQSDKLSSTHPSVGSKAAD